jgi:hypothetical protein
MKEVLTIDWMKSQKELSFQRKDLACGVYYLMVKSTDNAVIGTCKIVIPD